MFCSVLNIKVLALEDRATARKGLTAAKCASQKGIWESEEMAVQFCEREVESVLGTLGKTMVANPEQTGLLKHFSALWLLCHGNGQNADVVGKKEEFLRYWAATIDDCITKDMPLLTLVCLGVTATVFINSPQRRSQLMMLDAPTKIVALLKKYSRNPLVNIQCFILLGDLSNDFALEHTQGVAEGLEIAVKNWREHYLANHEVSCVILDLLAGFVSQSASNLKHWNAEELAERCIELCNRRPGVERLGKTFLDRMAKANSTHRRGSILPLPLQAKLRATKPRRVTTVVDKVLVHEKLGDPADQVIPFPSLPTSEDSVADDYFCIYFTI